MQHTHMEDGPTKSILHSAGHQRLRWVAWHAWQSRIGRRPTYLRLFTEPHFFRRRRLSSSHLLTTHLFCHGHRISATMALGRDRLGDLDGGVNLEVDPHQSTYSTNLPNLASTTSSRCQDILGVVHLQYTPPPVAVMHRSRVHKAQLLALEYVERQRSNRFSPNS